MSIDEDGRRAVDAQRLCSLDICRDCLLDAIAVHVTLKLIDVESQFPSIRNKYGTRVVELGPRLLVSIKPIVHLPKLILQVCGFSGSRCGHCILVNRG